MLLRADSLAATHAVAAVLAGLARPGDVIVLAGDMGAGKTAFAQGFGRALGVTEPITSPTFTLVHSYKCGKLTFHHVDLYRLERMTEVADLALAELAEFGGIVLVEWGDVVAASLGDHLVVRLDPVDGDEEARVIEVAPVRLDVGEPLAPTVERPRGVAMLILGIETATEQVSVAIGGHEGVISTFEVARGRRHAEILVPAIEFMCRQADIELCELGCIAVDVGPGLFTGMRVGLAAGKALAQALRIPMIGISSLDLLAFPHRHTDRVVVPVIDARKGEVFWAMYRQVPGGVQQVTVPTVGPVDELVADLLARSQEVLCVGDGAIRYHDAILDGYRCEFGSSAHPSAAPLVQLAHARALREEWVSPRQIEPIYLRLPDAQINWATRGSR